jgi:uncharacterized short protein YbdD (DUF466 family)
MGRLVDVIGQVRWYVASLMGDNHYQRYAAHRRRVHPGEPVITESEYWRRRHRAADADPGARCC